jgi:hypothetical protein
MGTALLLKLLLPLIPDLLNFLSVQLEKALIRQSPNVPPHTDEQIISQTVRLIVDQIDDAHKDWPNTTKSSFAADAIRHHLQSKHEITLADGEVNLLVELAVMRKRASGRRP